MTTAHTPYKKVQNMQCKSNRRQDIQSSILNAIDCTRNINRNDAREQYIFTNLIPNEIY